jgi:hypothetical protein
MLSQVIARLALVAAFVLVGQAALLHPITHVDQQGGLVHVPGKDKTPGKLCDVLGALTSCLSDAPSKLLDVVPFQKPIALSRGAPRVAEAPPFLSQGPPALL